MITKENKNIAWLNWQKASQELGFKIISPYFLDKNKGKIEVFAFLPEYGSPNGTIIELMSEPEYKTDKDVIKYVKKNNHFYSFINVENFLKYNSEYFREILEDWGKYESL